MAFSMPAAGSMGLRARDRPRMISERSDVDHDFVLVAGAALVRRIDAPFSKMRWALCSKRSQIASAWLGSPMAPYQSLSVS